MPGDPRSPGNSRERADSAKAPYQEYLERPLCGYLRDRALSDAQRHRDPEVLPQRLQAGAARAVSRPARRAVEELEVLDERYQRTRAVAAIHGRVSGYRPAYLDAVRAVARGAGRPQVVCPGGDRICDPRCARIPRPAFPACRQGLAARIQAGAQGAGARGEAACEGQSGAIGEDLKDTVGEISSSAATPRPGLARTLHSLSQPGIPRIRRSPCSSHLSPCFVTASYASRKSSPTARCRALP